MKNIVLLILLLMPFTSSCSKDRKLPDLDTISIPRYSTNLTMPSNILGMSINFSILLPQNYKSNLNQRYGVVYLLHGYGDNHQSWNDIYLNVQPLIESQEKEAGLPPMIYVMPQGFKSYYVNRYDGSFNYMDMFVKELVPFIDKTYRTIPDKQHRALIGYSMGGFGAMILASKNPSVFSVSVPLSMSFRTDQQYMTESQSGWDGQWGSIFGGKGKIGEERLTPYYKENSPFYLFNDESVSTLSTVNYFVDCGDDEEQLLVGNDDWHVLMRNLNLHHEYRVRNGAHTSTYWRSAMIEVLSYINSCFNNQSYSYSHAIELPETLKSQKLQFNIENKLVTVYLPSSYDDDNTSTYTPIFMIDNQSNSPLAEDLEKVLEMYSTAKKYILFSFDGAEVNSTIFESILNELQGKYRLFTESDKRIAVTTGSCGQNVYNLSSYWGSIFFFDAQLNDVFKDPATNLFYYIDIADEGKNYTSANALYKKCHELKVPFEYRVRNGDDSKTSIIEGFVEARTQILSRINFKL